MVRSTKSAREIRRDTSAWLRKHAACLGRADWWAAVAVVLGLLGSMAPAQTPGEAPVAGRPANFSGGVGTFRISARANPTELVVEGRTVLTLRIVGKGDFARIKRPDLSTVPTFKKRGQITNGGERSVPETPAREFDYVLRPLRADVKEIPRVPFVFF